MAMVVVFLGGYLLVVEVEYSSSVWTVESNIFGLGGGFIMVVEDI